MSVAPMVSVVFAVAWMWSAAPAQAEGAKDISAIAGSAGDGGFDHSPWDDLLGRFVRGGAVEYGRWKADAAASAALDTYLASLSSVSPKSLGGRNQRMAFWINAYNACVVDMVLDLMPLRSVMDVEGFFKKKACAVGGAKRSLDDIEKGVLLRAPFGDPRLHFAINCASISCPPLESKAWGSKGLDRRLDRAAGAFIRGGGARPDPASGTLKLSRIFEWYAGDFRKQAGSVQAYVGRYLPAADPVKAGELSPVFDKYDWSLNGR